MPNYFEIFADKLNEFGAFTYLFPFILISAIVFALFRKAKVLGDSMVINGVVSISLAFMIVFGFPIATGFSIASPLSTFFMQVSIFMLIFVVAVMAASMFYPNMQEWLPTVFKSRGMLMILIALGVAIFVTSGLVEVFTIGFGSGTSESGSPSAPRDVILISAGIVIFVVLIMIAVSIASGRARGGGHD